MAAGKQRPKFVVIVGPTASGKSELAMRLASQFSGEIIAADSRTVYKGADIGTSKPSDSDQKRVPHWGVDLVETGQRFSAKQFKDYAEQKIKEIGGRGHLPIVVGGTGLYIDSLLFDFGFRPTASQKEREKLEKLSAEELQEKIKKLGYKMPENAQNKRHLVRVLESGGAGDSRAQSPPDDVLLVGLLPERTELKKRIEKQVDTMFKDGVVKETARLIDSYADRAAGAGIVYKICQQVLAGQISEQEARDKVKTLHWQYARRQMTWFKRNPFILWFETVEQACGYVISRLNT